MMKLVYTNGKKEIVFNGEVIDVDEYTLKLNINKHSFDYLGAIEKQNIDGLSFEEFYMYDNIPLYFFYRPSLFVKLKLVISIVMLIKSLTEEFDGISIETDNDIVLKAARDIFNIEQIKFSEEKKVDAPGKKQGLNLKFAQRLYRGAKSYIKFYLKRGKGKNFMFCSHAADLNLIKLGKTPEYYNTQTGSIADALQRDWNLFDLQLLNRISLIDKSLEYRGSYIPFEYFIMFKRFNGVKKGDSEHIRDNLKYIERIDYTFQDHNLKDLILCYVMKGIKGNYLSYLNELLAAERFLRKNKINKCLVVGEGDRGRCFITAGNRMGIKTYAVQHGIINQTAATYIINSKYGDNIVPKKTFLWGERYRELLKENTNVYKDCNTEVVGQVRTDLLFKNRNREVKASGKIRVLYATQYLRDLLEGSTKMLFEALNTIDNDYELVIKLHPADTAWSYYEEMIQKYKIKNAKIVMDGDLYELIDWCDVIVSVHSTVVMEGVLLDRPSICIVLPKYNDAGGFIRDGISLGARDRDELAGALVNIVSGDFEYKRNLKGYVEHNFYKIDGRVTERIVKLIGD